MRITDKLAPHSYNKDFVACLETLEKELGWELFNLSGIGDQLDSNYFAKQFFKGDNTADSSVDPNSNVSDSSVVAYHFEAHKPSETINALYRLWKGLIKLKKNKYKKQYNDNDFVEYKALQYANDVIKKQISGDIYINDITGISTNRSYCYNYCTLDVANFGIPKDFDGEGVLPPKHLTTFFSQLLDFMIFAGNSTLGAVGVADALITATCFFKKVLKQQGDDGVNFSSQEDCWKHLESKIEKFLYDINKPNRANQSLFSNISIYDDIFLAELCPNYKVEIDGELFEADVETVKLVQDTFIKVYNKEQKRRLMTFPVLTPCFALDENKNLLRKDFLKKCVEQNQEFKMMNFYFGETSTLSSCCFDKNQEICYSPDETYIQRDVTMIDTLKEIYKNYKDKLIYVSASGTFMKARPIIVPIEDKKMYRITFYGNIDSILCTEDHIFPTNNGDKFARDLNIDDKFSVYNHYYTILKPKKTPELLVGIEKIEIVKDYNESFVYCLEMEDHNSPYFNLPSGLLVGNCRLRSKKDTKYMNTIGSGAVKVGSIGVCTINLPRASFKYHDKQELFKELENLVEICQTVNYIKRTNIKKAISQGRIPLYSHGFININTQYNTVGVIGFNEMCDNLNIDIISEEGQNLVVDIMNVINKKNEEMSDRFEVASNCEQIPGENVAIKLATKDTILGFNNKHEMYSNQFIPLVSQANMFDRIDLQAKFDKHFGGGSILHINIDELNADIDTQVDLIEAMSKKGVIYFAFNSIIGVCNDCGKNSVQHKKDVSSDNTGKCKYCKSTNVDVAFRVVGFVRKVKNWAKGRRKEFSNRKFYVI